MIAAENAVAAAAARTARQFSRPSPSIRCGRAEPSARQPMSAPMASARPAGGDQEAISFRPTG